MADTDRYVVKDWHIGNAMMYCVWDSVWDERHDSPLWLTKTFAQKHADQLNERKVKIDA